jgi:methionyl-tRNA formyltransferase
LRVLFMGTPSFAVPSLRALLGSRHLVVAVVTQPDRPSGRGLRIQPSPVKALAERHGLQVLQPSKIRTPEFLASVRALEPDLLVVVAFGRILPPALLEAAPRGGVNLHASLLPKYRGAAPVAWAVAHGESETGVTTMRMVEKLDAGEILLQLSTPIGPDETTARLEPRLAEMGASLLIETLDALEADQIAFLRQREEQATFAPVIEKEDGLIDWTMTAARIACRVRAFDPWPVAFTRTRRKVIRVWGARPGSEAEAAAAGRAEPPGRVLRADRSGVAVECGGGTLLHLVEIQPEGRRRMTAGEAAAGRYVGSGDVLG